MKTRILMLEHGLTIPHGGIRFYAKDHGAESEELDRLSCQGSWKCQGAF